MKLIPIATALIALQAIFPALAQHHPGGTATAAAPCAAAPVAEHPSALPARQARMRHEGDTHAPMAAMHMEMPSPPCAAAAEPDRSPAPMGPMHHEGVPLGSHPMPGALGPYTASREASGTSWQPDTSTHGGVHAMRGDWMLMAHGLLDLVYDNQSGPRGGNRTFASGMFMGSAQRPLGNGTLQLKAMLSPDPLMGARGYPLLLASGETANGVDRLVDRQHPHDFFMELAASVSHDLGSKSSVFLYGGLPGEPAFGPPAFMHREAIMDSPEAPITHHWLDSTHISMGVLTAGVVAGRAKLEVSRFNAREPDEHRWNIETGALDSTAVRASWNPVDTLALQASWGHFKDPEQLEPGVDQKRWSASAMYARELSPEWRLAGTVAWGRKSIEHHGEVLGDDAYAVEVSLKHRRWSYFGRAESTANRELVEAPTGHGPAFRVGKVSVGAVRDVALGEKLLLGVGALVAVDVLPAALQDLYGGRHPMGAMGFVRLKSN